MKRIHLRRLIQKIIEEGAPLPGKGGLAGLFSDEMTKKLMSTFGDDDVERTEQLVPYSDDLSDYDVESQIMRSPPTRTRNIPVDSPNPHVPGETYDDTRQRVHRTADDLKTKASEISKRNSEKMRAANREFKKSWKGDGTGVLPHNEPFASESTLDLQDLEDVGSSLETDDHHEEQSFDFERFLSDFGGDKDETSDIESTFIIDKDDDHVSRIHETTIDGTQEKLESNLSRGSLYRRKYFGRY